MCFYKFRDIDERFPVPYFVRKKPETIDRLNEANAIAAAQRVGIQVPMDWAYKSLGIPKPKAGEEILEPSFDAFGESMREPGEAEGDGARGNAAVESGEDQDGEDDE
jgi:phage gp29-like protein